MNKLLDISIELSSYCNAKCEVCKRHIDKSMTKYLNKNMDIDILLEFIKKQNPNEVKITLSGILGEPILYPHLDRVLDIIFEMGFYLKMHTNFDCKNDIIINKLKKILNSDKLELWVAIDSLDLNRHEIYRGTNLKNILYNLDLIGNDKKGIIIRSIIFEHNEQDYNNIKEFCKNNNYELVMTVSCLYTDNLKPPKNIKLLEGTKNTNYCAFELFITVEGLVLPCCHALNNLNFNDSPKDSIMLFKNKEKLNIKNIHNIFDIFDNEYIKLYQEQKANWCFKCNQRTKDKNIYIPSRIRTYDELYDKGKK